MTQIDVLYKGSEFQFNIEESDLNNFDKFMENLREKINEKDEKSQIKIMTFNTSVSYLYLNKDNFYEILNEFKNSTLKVVINVIKPEEKKEVIMKHNDELDDVLVGYKKKKDEIDLDFFDEEDYINEKKKENEEKEKKDEYNINNINNEEKEKKDEENINNINNEEKEKKDEEDINKNNINNEEKNQININEIININDNINEEKKDQIEIKNIPENIIQEENINNNIHNEPSMSIMFPKYSPYEENKDENNKKIIPLFPENKNNSINENGLSIKLDSDDNEIEKIIPEEHKKLKIYSNEFSEEICSMCNNELEGLKYICCICDKCILCDICEEKHHHPVFKYKKQFLSTISETFNFIGKMNKFDISNNPIKLIGGLFEKDSSISIEPDTDYDISIRPYKKIRIPVQIKNNNNKDSINSKNFLIIIRNFTQVNIYYNDNIDYILKPKENKIIYFTCESGGKTCKENITFEFVSNKIKFKENDKTKFNMTITVNEDEEEEELNKEFKNYDGICLLSKKHKQQILNVINMKKTNHSPLEIYYILKNHNWDISLCGELLQ